MNRLFSKENIGAWTLGILCFQGFGIRIFEGVIDGAIVLWLLVLAIINRRYLTRTPLSYWAKMVLLVLLYFLFCLIKGVMVVPFLIIAWLSSAVVLTRYLLGESFVGDMRKLTRFCMYYSLLHVPIMLLFGPFIINTNLGMHPKTFCFLFWFNHGEGVFGLNRIQGFCWEPSCWNIFLDLNLVFAFSYKEKRSIQILSILAIVSIMSTTGIAVMGIILVAYFLLSLQRKQFFKTVFISGIVFAILAPFVYAELEKKLSDGSGNARMGDFAIAGAVMLQSPIWGADLDNITKNMVAIAAREDAWTSQGDFEGYMEQGMVNSFAALFVEWGLPITLLIFYTMYKTPLVEERKLKQLLVVTILSVLMGTPIARTGFFYLFFLSTLLISRRKIVC